MERGPARDGGGAGGAAALPGIWGGGGWGGRGEEALPGLRDGAEAPGLERGRSGPGLALPGVAGRPRD